MRRPSCYQVQAWAGRNEVRLVGEGGQGPASRVQASRLSLFDPRLKEELRSPFQRMKRVRTASPYSWSCLPGPQPHRLLASPTVPSVPPSLHVNHSTASLCVSSKSSCRISLLKVCREDWTQRWIAGGEGLTKCDDRASRGLGSHSAKIVTLAGIDKEETTERVRRRFEGECRSVSMMGEKRRRGNYAAVWQLHASACLALVSHIEFDPSLSFACHLSEIATNIVPCYSHATRHAYPT